MHTPQKNPLARWLASAYPAPTAGPAGPTNAKNQQLRQLVQWSLGGLAVVAVAPMVYLLIQGVLGLAAAALAGLAAINAAPVVALKLANWRMRTMRSEVQANPMDSLERQLIERGNELQQREAQLIDRLAAAAVYKPILQRRALARPQMAEQYRASIERVDALCAGQRQAAQQARDSFQRFAEAVEEARQDWAFRSAESDFARSFGSTGARTAAAAWEEKVAFTAVRAELERSFALLDAALTNTLPPIDGSQTLSSGEVAQ